MKLDWSELALNDRIENFYYIANESVTSANKVDDAIEASADQLITFPELGRPGRIKGTRELVVTGLPYIIAYRISANEVYILRVLHTAQRWPDSLPE